MRETINNERVVVTRHPSLISYLKEKNFISEDSEIINHANKDNIRNKDVIGVLPISLANEARTFTEIPLAVPVEFRGRELTLEEIREFSGDPVTYVVKVVDSLKGFTDD